MGIALIAGLGNPGPQYRNTRHNVGFALIDRLAEATGIDVTREKHKGLYGEGRWQGHKIRLLKPQTFMNRSGESVSLAARNSVEDAAGVLVVYDEAELPLGRLRLRPDGSAGTHNGMKSVIEYLGVQEVPRLRLGVGAKAEGQDLADHVLGGFRPDERPVVEEMIARAVQAVLRCVEAGVDAAMNEFNR